MVLKYLFTAEYDDGTSFSQTEEDVSVVEKTRSAFYDVLNSGKQVTRFSIQGEGHRYSVDLGTGGFTCDGNRSQARAIRCQKASHWSFA